MHLLRQAIWGNIWKDTVEKRQTNATNATMHPLGQAIWGHIWRHTVEKSQTNAINVTLLALRQAIWGIIWKFTVEKSQTNATSVIMHPLIWALWGHIWRHTVEKSQTNATNVILHPLIQVLWGHIWKHTAIWGVKYPEQVQRGGGGVKGIFLVWICCLLRRGWGLAWAPYSHDPQGPWISSLTCYTSKHLARSNIGQFNHTLWASFAQAKD